MSKKRIIIIVIVIIGVIIVAGLLCNQRFFFHRGFPVPTHKINTQPQASSVNPYAQAKIEIKTYKVDIGWGYDIYVDSKMAVHQPNIPALPGNSGFDTESDAKKAAELVVGKIKKNIVPPSLSAEELKSIGITGR
jgi:hypothetical protein